MSPTMAYTSRPRVARSVLRGVALLAIGAGVILAFAAEAITRQVPAPPPVDPPERTPELPIGTGLMIGPYSTPVIR
jgi:hypothetical protein